MRIGWVVAAVVLCGCVESSITVCEEGRVCPPSSACDEVHKKCVLPEQLTSCVGMATGTPCTIAGDDVGVCSDEVCLVAGCGDGIVAGSEDCDLGVPTERDDCTENGFHNPGAVSCTDQCTLNLDACSGKCGDGVVEGGEACDYAGTEDPSDDALDGKDCLAMGFHNAPGLACSKACTFDISACTGFCGDGVVNGNEACDGTQLGGVDSCDDIGFYDTDPISCTQFCVYDTTSCDGYCGDGIKNGNEVCDPGATTGSGDDVLGSNTCSTFGFYNSAGLTCSSACTFDTSQCTGYCGDGVIGGGEECDGAALAGVDSCDDIGFYDTDAVTCTSFCTYNKTQCDQFCGDGTVNGGEACDPGPTSGPGDDALDGANCTNFAYYTAAGLTCSAACTYVTSGCSGRCGDGVKDSVEECDDNGTPGIPGDDKFGGADCQDLGYYNTTTLKCSAACGFDESSCTGYCGDRVKDPVEICEAYPPFDETCLDYGYESGPLSCLPVCGPDFSGCVKPGWTGFDINNTDYNDVWMAGSADAFAVGTGGSVQRWNGIAWSAMTQTATTQTLNGVWGAGPNDVFAVGNGGAIIHWNGTAWSAYDSMTTNNLLAVWGADAGNVFAVGASGTIRKYTSGTSWSVMTSNTAETLNGVWGADATTVWAVGNNNTVQRLTSGTWQTITVLGTARNFNAVWGTSASNVFVVGSTGVIRRATDGATFSFMTSNTTDDLLDIWGSGPNNLYVTTSTVGSGRVHHYDGTSWSAVDSGTNVQLNGIWGKGTNELVAVGNAGIMRHYVAAQWLPSPPGNTVWYFDVWGASSNDVVAVGQAGQIAQFDGTTWTSTVPGGDARDINGIWGVDGGQTLYAVGAGGRISQRVLGTWGSMSSPTTQALYGVWGTSFANAFAVGAAGTIARYTGALGWNTTTSGTETLRAVWGSSATDAWAVGDKGAITHWNGTSWSLVLPAPTSDNLFDVWGSGPNDVFAVSDFDILHWDGRAWSKMYFTGGFVTFSGVWGTGPADVFAIGTEESVGVIYHYDGIVWSRMRATAPQNLDGIYAVSANDLFVVGRTGTFLRRERVCAASEGACGDGLDNDCDGRFDCGDSDCTSDSTCSMGGLCAGATQIACGPTTGSTTSGPQRIDRYACDPTLELGNEQSYYFIAAKTGTVTATLSNMTDDLDVIILEPGAGGGCEPRNPGCLAMRSTGSNETVAFPVVSGKKYFVVIDGYGTSRGDFTLDLACPP